MKLQRSAKKKENKAMLCYAYKRSTVRAIFAAKINIVFHDIISSGHTILQE